MSSAATNASLSRGVIHFVDDNPELRSTVARVLPTQDVDVRTYDSADDFFARFLPTCPCVAIIDMRMPIASGLDLLRRARAQGLTCPFIFVSGEATAHEAVEAMKQGATDFLFKPVTLARLRDVASNALRRHVEIEQERADAELFRQRYRSLTPRERDLCPYVAEDRSIKDIAARFTISEPTVKIHKARILKKMAASSPSKLALELRRFEATIASAAADDK